MKYLVILIVFVAFATKAKSQAAPKVYDPCLKLDTNQIKQLIIGTWVEVKDTTHVMVITQDSVEEVIVIPEGVNRKRALTYWNYKFTDNVFSSDDVTCYSIVEYKDGFTNHITTAINAIDQNYLLLGATGKVVFRRKN